MIDAIINAAIRKKLPAIVEQISASNYRCLAIYGGGTHTAKVLEAWGQVHDAPEILYVIQTEAPPHKVSFLGLPVVGVREIQKLGIDAIILSSHAYEHEMFRCAMRYLPPGDIYGFYGDQRNTSWFANQIVREFLQDDKITIYDIGALGIEDFLNLNHFWPGIPKSALRIVAFEPDVQECERIRIACEAAGIEVITIAKALGKVRGRKPLYLARNRSASSIFPPDVDSLRNYRYQYQRLDEAHETERIVDVDIDTLDSIRSEFNLPDPDFIKINAEGAELDILTASLESIRNACGLQVELNFISKCIGGGMFSDVDPMLRAAGFEFCDILTLNEVVHQTQQLNFHSLAGNRQISGKIQGAGMNYTRVKLEGHFLYFNRLFSNGADDAPRPMKSLKMACFQETYGHPDAALATVGHLVGRIKRSESQQLKTILQRAYGYYRSCGVANIETNPDA